MLPRSRRSRRRLRVPSRYLALVAALIVANPIAFTVGCSEERDSPSAQPPASEDASDGSRPLGPGLFVDAEGAVQPYKPDGSEEGWFTKPGLCISPDGSGPHGCDRGLICVVWSEVDGGMPGRDPPADAGVADANQSDREFGCIGLGRVDASRCGEFACGPGCECHDPDRRICVCQ